MKTLLAITAVLEAPTGLALLVTPSLVATLLLGVSLDTPAALVVGRVAGGALLALGVACWLSRNDGASPAARGLVAAMVLYNIATAAVLAYAGAGLGLFSIVLWPVVILHASFAVWCVACLRRSLVGAAG